MLVVIKSRSLGFQPSMFGSSDEKLILRMFLGSTSILSSFSQLSLLLRGLVMVRISSLTWRLSASFQARPSRWLASNFDLRSFAIVERLPVSRFHLFISSSPYTRQYHEFYSCDTQNTSFSLCPPFEVFFKWCALHFSGFGAHLYQTDEICGMGASSAGCACHGGLGG